MDAMCYTEDELKKLHLELYDILREIQRVCDQLGIKCFIQGGSAIGAFFEKEILPWDDDIDVGMIRQDFDRFLREAPALLKPQYFLQWVGSEEHFPQTMAKVRKEGTEFRQHYFRNVPMHHGIFVDIMPYDKVPDNALFQKTHRSILRFLSLCIINQEVWGWKYFRTSAVDKPASNRFMTALAVFVVSSLFSRKQIFRVFSFVSAMFNRYDMQYYNQAKEFRDHISVKSLHNMQIVQFGPLQVYVPDDLETYLRHHYPNLRRTIPDEEKLSHGPDVLRFSDDFPNDVFV